MTLWEAHKCYIRGILIKIGAEKKRKNQTQLNELLLENQHKKTLSPETLAELMKCREELKDRNTQTIKASMFRCQRKYYEQGNKSGRLLANTIKRQRVKAFVPQIVNGPKQMSNPTGIARAFRDFYQNLYDLPRNKEQG